ncbi:ANTAR domain-containing protein [Streptomyces sp. SAS_270]|uniref:ANTAR domain-containing protein n=1 Tax=Streptomyces sp. SAS_270 TaxID=3412748 RepID=UPI00403C5878
MSHHATLPRNEGPCPECGTTLKQSPTPAPVTFSVDTAGDRFFVTVSGELDLDSDQALQQTLSDALNHDSDGLELDLAGVDFRDCSALTALLHVRRRAHETAESLTPRAGSPAADSPLGLAHTLPHFTVDAAGPPAHPATTARPTPAQPAPTADSAGEDLAAENAQLRRALQTRATIDLARGMLMASFHLTTQQSWQALVTASQHSNTKLHLIAAALLQTADGQALPEPLAGHLATAVETHRTPAD